MEFYKEELKKSLEDTIEGLEKHSQDAIALDLFYTAVKNSKSLEEYVIPFVADKIESAIFSIEFNLEQKEKLGLDTDVKLGVYVDDLKKNNWDNHNLPTFSEPSLEQSSFSAKVKLMGIEYKEKLNNDSDSFSLYRQTINQTIEELKVSDNVYNEYGLPRNSQTFDIAKFKKLIDNGIECVFDDYIDADKEYLDLAELKELSNYFNEVKAVYGLEVKYREIPNNDSDLKFEILMKKVSENFMKETLDEIFPDKDELNKGDLKELQNYSNEKLEQNESYTKKYSLVEIEKDRAENEKLKKEKKKDEEFEY